MWIWKLSFHMTELNNICNRLHLSLAQWSSRTQGNDATMKWCRNLHLQKLLNQMEICIIEKQRLDWRQTKAEIVHTNSPQTEQRNLVQHQRMPPKSPGNLVRESPSPLIMIITDMLSSRLCTWDWNWCKPAPRHGKLGMHDPCQFRISMRGNGLLDYILQFEHGAWKGVEDLRGIPANTLRPPKKCESIKREAASWVQQ